jgi:hypothetical protein
MIFNYIDSTNIIDIDDYNNESIHIYTFDNIKFRTYNSNYFNFQTQLGIQSDNKIISITNKQFSYLIHKYIHFLGDQYANELKNNYEAIKNETDITIVEEEVFQFIDYDSVTSTGHSYDVLFFLLYHYKINNLTSKLLVVESNNQYYNSLLEMIKKYFNVEFYYIQEYKTYLFKTFFCCRTYQNILFDYVKTFINKNLIEPLINVYDNLNISYYERVLKIKYKSLHTMNRLNSCFENNETLKNFCNLKQIFDLNTIDDNEELKIYLLNKAKIIIVDWSSIYFININYYLLDSENKFISVIFHSNAMPDRCMINKIENICYQNMPYWACPICSNNVYNIWNFKGEIIDNITDINDFILQTTI